jgi:PAS domain S-box-containing protein
LPLPPTPPIDHLPSNMDDEHNSIFFAAVSTTRMPMVVTDPNAPDNPIVFANPAFLEMTGYDNDEVVGHNCRFLQGPETDRTVVDEVRDAVAARKEIAVELLNYRKNGSTFWNALFLSPVYDNKGNLIYFFASQLDVTRRRDAEDALRQSQKMEAVGQLTGGIAHDFNNLLTVIQGFGETLYASIGNPRFVPTKAKRHAQAIVQAAEKGAALTQQLLSFARKQKLSGRIVNLPDLIDQLRPLIEKSVGEGIELEIKHDPDQCNARIDVVQAELALLNIVINARDAMNENGKLVIETTSLDLYEGNQFGVVGEYICLKITDTGAGMDAFTLQRVTEPFFTTKPEGQGTGLGLSMVYGFVKQSEGHFHIESVPGQGTTVYLLFQRASEKVDPPVVKSRSVSREVRDDVILIVEDKPEVLEYAEAVLSENGYKIITASNAKDALEIINGPDRIDLMFSDIMMPGGMNGVLLAREAQLARPNLKVLLTTGYTESAVERTDALGRPYPYVAKPYRRVEITKMVRQTIDGPTGV